jgi:hypothetical protein
MAGMRIEQIQKGFGGIAATLDVRQAARESAIRSACDFFREFRN